MVRRTTGSYDERYREARAAASTGISEIRSPIIAKTRTFDPDVRPPTGLERLSDREAGDSRASTKVPREVLRHVLPESRRRDHSHGPGIDEHGHPIGGAKLLVGGPPAHLEHAVLQA